MYKEKTASNLRAIKEARKMTMEQIAEASGTTIGTVFNHLKYGIPSVESLMKYCEALGCEPSDLLKGSSNLEKFTLERDISSFYPYNLALAVMIGCSPTKEMIDAYHDRLYKVYVPALVDSLNTLTDREQKVIKLRFKHGMILEDVGREFNVTKGSIHQVEAKALRKLRHPSRSRYWFRDTIGKAFEIEGERARLERENCELKERLSKYETIEYQEEISKPKIDISEMDLSVRSYNCLKRAGINYVHDLEDYTIQRLMQVRNLGKRSMTEIVDKAREFGVLIRGEGDEE